MRQRLALYLISLLTPATDREWVIGDTVEEFDRISRSAGAAAARGWLWREMWRVVWHAARHGFSVPRGIDPAGGQRGDGLMSTLWQDIRYGLRLLGRTIAVGQGGFQDGATVVGVVSNVRYGSIELAPRPDVYIPVSQSHQPRMRLFVRSDLDRGSLVRAITREVRALDPNLPLSEIKSLGEWVGDAMWRTRVGMWLLSAFAALALLLTAIGIFGVMAQTVMQRTPEIGIRMALGAQRRDVLSLVLGQAALLTGAGLAVGVGSALALTRLMSTLLYGVPPHDPLTFGAVVAILMVVALAACYIPARRATRIDAVVALRTE